MALSRLGLIRVASASLNRPSAAPFHALGADRILIWCPSNRAHTTAKAKKVWVRIGYGCDIWTECNKIFCFGGSDGKESTGNAGDPGSLPG